VAEPEHPTDTVAGLLQTARRRHLRLTWIPYTLFILLALLSLAGYLITRPRPISSGARTIADQGQPIAEAIQRYHADVGRLPEQLIDLVPRYLERIPAGWEYRRNSEDHWCLLCDCGTEPVWLDSQRSIWAVGTPGHGTRFIPDRPAPRISQDAPPPATTP
jgi:hypothetical protein